MELKKCKVCGTEAVDHYVYVQCPNCGLATPWSNHGVNNDSADNMDHQIAMLNWNMFQDCIKLKIK